MAILVGCGSGDHRTYGASYIETRLPVLYAARGGEMSEVACVKRSDRVYRCAATVALKATPKDIAHINLEVTINPDTGKFVTRLL